MESTRNAWIQVPDYTYFEIGDVSRSEIDRLWGSRWALKCIRDTAEQVAIDRFSPKPREKNRTFCSPQLGFENDGATLVVSPVVDVQPAILYGLPLQDFVSWTVYLHVKRGRRLFGLIPVDYAFETVVSQDESLELIRLFFDHRADEILGSAKAWREQINQRYRHRLVGAFFL